MAIERDPERREGTAEKVGEGVGGVAGGATGAALGALAGPLGFILGGLAGAVGGWWAGEKVGQTVDEMDPEDEKLFSDRFATIDGNVEDLEAARVGYTVGYVAGRNPDYRGRTFEDVELDLRRGFLERDRDWSYTFADMRPYVRSGYERSRHR